MSLYKRLHEAEVPEGPTNRRDPVLDELRQKIHHHLIEELGPVLYDKRLNEQEAELWDLTHRATRHIFKQEKYDLILQDAVMAAPTVDITNEVIKALATAAPAAQ